MTIPIIEMFLSIEGEGIRAGRPCTFIRTAGCNLRCSYCDTTYSYEGGTMQSIQQIVDHVEQLGCGAVTITGGEPLLHKEVREKLIPRLLELDYQINIETNGSIDLNKLPYRWHPNIILTVDWKSLSSGMNDKMLCSNIELIDYKDVLKFVVGTTEDLREMARVINTYAIKAQVFVSPIFGQIPMADIVQFILKNNLFNVRLQCQLHKIIYPIDARGV